LSLTELIQNYLIKHLSCHRRHNGLREHSLSLPSDQLDHVTFPFCYFVWTHYWVRSGL